MKFSITQLAGGLLLLLGILGARPAPAAAPATNTNFRGLPGLLFEAEDWSTPRTAWLTNQAAADKWRLWTTEGKGKRSRDAALVSGFVRGPSASTSTESQSSGSSNHRAE